MQVNTDYSPRIGLAHGATAFLLGLLFAIPIALWAGRMSPHAAAEDNKYVCITEQIPTSWGFDNPPATIEKHSIEFTETGKSTPGFYFRNLSASHLQALAAVIKYTDNQGRTIDDVPIVAGTDQLSNFSQLPFAVEQVQHWKRSVAPNEEVIVAGVYDGIRTGICPAHATVTFLRLRFAGSKTLDFSAPGWYIRPMARSVPGVPESFAKLKLNPPDFLVGQLRIDISGRVVDLTSDGKESAELVAWLRNFMQTSWKFYPALRDGRPIEAKVSVLFGFPRDRKSMLAQAPSVESPVLVIQISRTPDFIPGAGAQNEFAATFGGMAEGDVLGKGALVVVPGEIDSRP